MAFTRSFLKTVKFKHPDGTTSDTINGVMMLEAEDLYPSFPKSILGDSANSKTQSPEAPASDKVDEFIDEQLETLAQSLEQEDKLASSKQIKSNSQESEDVSYSNGTHEAVELSSIVKPRSFASLQMRAKNAMKGLFALNRERLLVLCGASSIDTIATACDMVRELTGIEATVAYAPTKFELFGNDKEDGILTASLNLESEDTKDPKSRAFSFNGIMQSLAAPSAGEVSQVGSMSLASLPESHAAENFNVVVMPCVHLIDHPKWLGMVEACLAQNDSLKLILVGDAAEIAQLSMFWGLLDNAIHADIVLEFSAAGALTTLAGLISHYQHNDRDGKFLLPFSRDALALLAAYSCRLSGDRRYIGLPELPLKSLIYEANRFAWLDAKQRHNKALAQADLDEQSQSQEELFERNLYVSQAHVLKALATNDFRNNFLLESSLREHRDRQLLVATKGAVVGQINGLSVIETLGTNYEYGEPVRITATLRAGGEGDVIDIERKAELAGQIHAKAMMIINGFLTKEFGSEQPLPVSASLVFEQSYSEVDGDSASLTGLCAVISVLAGVPIRQDLAVTGAVDQFGDVQAVGGVNEKIEGFYRVCRLHGFTSTQGVIIPSSCVNQLVLRPAVIKAVAEGKFHIFTVSHVTEAVKMLTTINWGDSDTENTICYRICERLNNIVAGNEEEGWLEQIKSRSGKLYDKLKELFDKDKADNHKHK